MIITICIALFLSTLSLRRATTWQRGSRITYVISIHALLAESDSSGLNIRSIRKNFYPRSPCGERPHLTASIITYLRFLSTLSLRRATIQQLSISLIYRYFYPRSPCGERLVDLWTWLFVVLISIHALLAESDLDCSHAGMITPPRISIHALLAESDMHFLGNIRRLLISIHALLAESDSRKRC